MENTQEWMNLNWINNLPEVGHPIRSKLADIQQDIQEINNKIKELENLKKQLFVEDIEPLLKKVDELWTREEIKEARNA